MRRAHGRPDLKTLYAFPSSRGEHHEPTETHHRRRHARAEPRRPRHRCRRPARRQLRQPRLAHLLRAAPDLRQRLRLAHPALDHAARRLLRLLGLRLRIAAAPYGSGYGGALRVGLRRAPTGLRHRTRRRPRGGRPHRPLPRAWRRLWRRLRRGVRRRRRVPRRSDPAPDHRRPRLVRLDVVPSPPGRASRRGDRRRRPRHVQHVRRPAGADGWSRQHVRRQRLRRAAAGGTLGRRGGGPTAGGRRRRHRP